MIAWAAGCDWRCCVQEDGWTALMAACSKGYTNIVKLLLAVPGVDVNAAKVSCVSGKRLHAVISPRYFRCEAEVWQEGWVRGRVSLEVDCVGGGLWLGFVAGSVQEDGWTALMVACSKGATDVVEMLLAVPGVDVNVADVSCVSGSRLHAVISHRHVRSLRG